MLSLIISVLNDSLHTIQVFFLGNSTADLSNSTLFPWLTFLFDHGAKTCGYKLTTCKCNSWQPISLTSAVTLLWNRWDRSQSHQQTMEYFLSILMQRNNLCIGDHSVIIFISTETLTHGTRGTKFRGRHLEILFYLII